MNNPSEQPHAAPVGWWCICRTALFIALLGFAACSGLSWWRYLGPGVNIRNYGKLKLGMSEKKVEFLLGARTRESESKLVGANGGELGPPSEWVGEELVVRIVFDHEGNAIYIARAWRQADGPKETLLGKIWRWFFPG